MRRVLDASLLSAVIALVLFTPSASAAMPFTAIDLGTLGGDLSRAVAINDHGQVTGDSRNAAGDRHAFLWTQAGGMIDLGTLGGDSSFGVAINDLGQVVGSSATASGETHA